MKTAISPIAMNSNVMVGGLGLTLNNKNLMK